MLKSEFPNQGIERHSQVCGSPLRTPHRIFVGADDPVMPLRKTKVKLTKPATAGKVEATKPAVKPMRSKLKMKW